MSGVLLIMVAGCFLKVVDSAYTRGANLSENINNVILAATTALSGSLVYFGLAQYAFMKTTIGALAKGMLSTHYRNKASHKELLVQIRPHPLFF